MHPLRSSFSSSLFYFSLSHERPPRHSGVLAERTCCKGGPVVGGIQKAFCRTAGESESTHIYRVEQIDIHICTRGFRRVEPLRMTFCTNCSLFLDKYTLLSAQRFFLFLLVARNLPSTPLAASPALDVNARCTHHGGAKLL
jgi:hypothetical protein